MEFLDLSATGRALLERFDVSEMSGEELREARKRIGTLMGGDCQQPDLAPLVNRTRQNISRYENGKADVPRELALIVRLIIRQLEDERNLRERVERLERQRELQN